MAEHCCRKRGVKFSAVFVTVRFWVVLSVSGKKADSNFAFSAKARRSTNRCWRKCWVILCAFGNIQRIQRRRKIKHFQQIRRVKRSVFAENAEWNGAFLVITRNLRKSGYVLWFKIYLNKFFGIRCPGLVYHWMMPKNCEKRTIKSRACVPLREGGKVWAVDRPNKESALPNITPLPLHTVPWTGLLFKQLGIFWGWTCCAL